MRIPSRSRLAVSLLLLVTLLISFSSGAQSRGQSPLQLNPIANFGRAELNGTVAWRPDGRLLAVSGKAGVWLYSDQLEERGQLTDEAGYGLAWTPDGKKLVVGGAKSQITVWDVERRARLLAVRLPRYEFSVFDVLMSPDGRRFAFGGGSEFRIWEVISGRLLAVIPIPDDTVSSPIWSPDGKYLAFRTTSSVEIYDAEGVQVQQSLDAGEGLRIAWSPDSSRVATVNSKESSDRNVATRIWDVRTGKLLLAIQTGLGSTLSWSPDGKYLATGSDSRYYAYNVSPDRVIYRVVVWDTATGEEVSSVWRQLPIRSVAWRPDGKQMAILSAENNVVIAPFPHGELITNRAFEQFTSSFNALAWSPDGRNIVSGGEDGSIRVWDVATGKVDWVRFDADPPTQVVSWSPDGSRIASGGRGFRTIIRDSSNGDNAVVFTHWQIALGFGEMGVRALSWNQQNTLASGATDGRILIYERNISSSPTLVFGDSEDAIYALSWFPDNRRLLSVSENLDLWNVPTATKLASWRCGDGSQLQGAVSPDGKVIVGGRAPCVWDVVTRQLIRRLEVADGETISRFVWHPNSRWITSYSYETSVNAIPKLRVWDVQTGDILLEIPAPSMFFEWSPDGTTLAIAGHGITLWRLSQ